MRSSDPQREENAPLVGPGKAQRKRGVDVECENICTRRAVIAGTTIDSVLIDFRL